MILILHKIRAIVHKYRTDVSIYSICITIMHCSLQASLGGIRGGDFKKIK